VVHKVLCDNSIPFSESNKESVCDACQMAKSHQLPYPKSTSVSTSPLELVFLDVTGPATESFGRFKYYVSFIDDYSKFAWIYLLTKKSDVFQKFQDFQHHVEPLFDNKSLQCKLTEEVSIKILIPFSNVLVSHISFHVPMRISKTALLNVNIDIS
jgi:hypothetical protein